MIRQIIQEVALGHGPYILTVGGNHRHSSKPMLAHQIHSVSETEILIQKVDLLFVRQEKEQILSQKRHPLKTLSIVGNGCRLIVSSLCEIVAKGWNQKIDKSVQELQTIN